MPQLTFTWPQAVSYAGEDFIVSASNRRAVQWVDSWPQHAASAALLSGPPASGKTHLMHRWIDRVQGAVLNPALLGTAASADIWPSSLPRYAALEDIHLLADETALFHLLRHCESHHLCLLLTSRLSAQELPFRLPDLHSRFRALPTMHIEPPDDALLRGFLIKCFADYQLRVSEEVITYLLRRTQRSFAGVWAMANSIERSSAEARKDITIPWLKSLDLTIRENDA